MRCVASAGLGILRKTCSLITTLQPELANSHMDVGQMVFSLSLPPWLRAHSTKPSRHAREYKCTAFNALDSRAGAAHTRLKHIEQMHGWVRVLFSKWFSRPGAAR
eukprot:5047073-Pyramimonas_sp.AAC.1